MQFENIIESRTSTILFPAIRQMRATLAASVFTLSAILIIWGIYVSGAEAAPAKKSVKWHPGHYVMIVSPGQHSPRHMEQVYGDLKQTPALRGVVIRYKWADLEKREGVYDFSSIDKHLAELTERKKSLIILMETKSFDPKHDLVPDYLKSKEYDGGQFPFSSSGSKTLKGYNLKLWDAQVRDRLAALIRAFGNRYNSKPYFEGFGFTETAMGQPMSPIGNNQANAYYDNLISLNKVASTSFPNTMNFQYTNFPRTELPSFVNSLKTMGAALGCPDIFLDEPGLHYQGADPGIYAYYAKHAGDMPLAVQVEKANYMDTRHGGKGYRPEVSKLYAFGRDKLKANYIFWTRSPGYFEKVQEMLGQSGQNGKPAGGLNAGCPASYGSCVTN